MVVGVFRVFDRVFWGVAKVFWLVAMLLRVVAGAWLCGC